MRRVWDDQEVHVDDTGAEDALAIRLGDAERAAFGAARSEVQVEPTLEHLPRGLTSLARHVGVAKSPDVLDFSVVRFDRPALATAVYTRSLCPSPAVTFDRENTTRGSIQAVCVISKNANVFTPNGREDVERIADALAHELDVRKTEVFISCTGVIGVPLPMDRITAGLGGLRGGLATGSLDPVSTAIMTTDKRPKRASIRVGDLVVGGYAKGAGMIEPNLATMLVYLYTNAAVTKPTLDRALKRSVDRTFNSISVDSDTSTSDTVALFATGERPLGDAELPVFQRALDAVCCKLARQVAGEAEGATKLIEVTVRLATSADDARFFAKKIVNSPLMKCAVHGADPNWGRVVAAIGKPAPGSPLLGIDPKAVTIRMAGETLYDGGRPLALDLGAVSATIKSNRVVPIDVTIGAALHTATVWGCDLSDEYVHENAHYTT